MPPLIFPKLKEIMENYSNDCIDKDNNVIINDKCDKMFLYLQQKILHKSRNAKIRDEKKNMTGVGFEPTHANIADLKSAPLDHSGNQPCCAN